MLSLPTGKVLMLECAMRVFISLCTAQSSIW